MMASEILLNKETAFFQLNRELEEKVQSLMVEVDSIINRQEDVMRAPKARVHPSQPQGQKSRGALFGEQRRALAKSLEEQSSSSTSAAARDDSCSTLLDKSIKGSANFLDTDTADEEPLNYESDEQGGAPVKQHRKKQRSANETIIRFLKAQVKKLQSEVQAAQHEVKKKNEAYKELEAELKRKEEKKEKLFVQLSTYKESILKAEVLSAEQLAKIQTQNTEISSLKKEIENLKRELKSLNQVCSNNDVRLNRSLEESEKLRLSLKSSQAEEKELREQMRKIQEEKRIALKNLEKQRTEIFQAFKKQTQLVDNLKKQKAYLEASKEIQFIEEDFTRLLEWKAD